MRGKEGKGVGGREGQICCSTYLCSHWLILICAPTGYWTINLGVSRWHSNQLRHLVGAPSVFLHTWCGLCLSGWPLTDDVPHLPQQRLQLALWFTIIKKDQHKNYHWNCISSVKPQLALFFNVFYWLCYYSCPISPPSLNSILPTPSLPHSPPIVHVCGSYL